MHSSKINSKNFLIFVTISIMLSFLQEISTEYIIYPSKSDERICSFEPSSVIIIYSDTINQQNDINYEFLSSTYNLNITNVKFITKNGDLKLLSIYPNNLETHKKIDLKNYDYILFVSDGNFSKNIFEYIRSNKGFLGFEFNDLFDENHIKTNYWLTMNMDLENINIIQLITGKYANNDYYTYDNSKSLEKNIEEIINNSFCSTNCKMLNLCNNCGRIKDNNKFCTDRCLNGRYDNCGNCITLGTYKNEEQYPYYSSVLLNEKNNDQCKLIDATRKFKQSVLQCGKLDIKKIYKNSIVEICTQYSELFDYGSDSFVVQFFDERFQKYNFRQDFLFDDNQINLNNSKNFWIEKSKNNYCLNLTNEEIFDHDSTKKTTIPSFDFIEIKTCNNIIYKLEWNRFIHGFELNMIYEDISNIKITFTNEINYISGDIGFISEVQFNSKFDISDDKNININQYYDLNLEYNIPFFYDDHLISCIEIMEQEFQCNLRFSISSENSLGAIEFSSLNIIKISISIDNKLYQSIIESNIYIKKHDHPYVENKIGVIKELYRDEFLNIPINFDNDYIEEGEFIYGVISTKNHNYALNIDQLFLCYGNSDFIIPYDFSKPDKSGCNSQINGLVVVNKLWDAKKFQNLQDSFFDFERIKIKKYTNQDFVFKIRMPKIKYNFLFQAHWHIENELFQFIDENFDSNDKLNLLNLNTESLEVKNLVSRFNEIDDFKEKLYEKVQFDSKSSTNNKNTKYISDILQFNEDVILSQELNYDNYPFNYHRKFYSQPLTEEFKMNYKSELQQFEKMMNQYKLILKTYNPTLVQHFDEDNSGHDFIHKKNAHPYFLDFYRNHPSESVCGFGFINNHGINFSSDFYYSHYFFTICFLVILVIILIIWYCYCNLCRYTDNNNNYTENNSIPFSNTFVKSQEEIIEKSELHNYKNSNINSVNVKCRKLYDNLDEDLRSCRL